MIVVGSRCGGYDFFAEIDGHRLWLGCEQCSDLDVFADTRPEAYDMRVDWIGTERWFLSRLTEGNLNVWCGVARPWSHDGALQMPPSMDFLSIAVRKKLRRQGIDWRPLLGTPCQILAGGRDEALAQITFRLVL